ncbi:MAG: helix-turn-helix transcriptional regulator [Niabella sp.]
MKAKNKNIATFSEHLDKRYGKIGSAKRTEFEIKAKSFAIGELIKEERKQAQLTQEQLAEKIGAKKSLYPELKTGIAISSYPLFISLLSMD